MTSLMLVPNEGIRDQGSGIKGIAVLDREVSVFDPEPRLPNPESRIPVPESVSLRTAGVVEAGAIHDLIAEHREEGRLLPRERAEIVVHAHRFVVALWGDEVVACAELAPLSRSVAEIRSLVVSRKARRLGVGRRLIETLLHRASMAGFDRICAFTQSPGYFVHLGFSIVPHAWLPEKIVIDCHACRHFRQCGQYAVVRSLERARHNCVPLAALHG